MLSEKMLHEHMMLKFQRLYDEFTEESQDSNCSTPSFCRSVASLSPTGTPRSNNNSPVSADLYDPTEANIFNNFVLETMLEAVKSPMKTPRARTPKRVHAESINILEPVTLDQKFENTEVEERVSTKEIIFLQPSPQEPKGKSGFSTYDLVKGLLLFSFVILIRFLSSYYANRDNLFITTPTVEIPKIRVTMEKKTFLTHGFSCFYACNRSEYKEKFFLRLLPKQFERKHKDVMMVKVDRTAVSKATSVPEKSQGVFIDAVRRLTLKRVKERNISIPPKMDKLNKSVKLEVSHHKRLSMKAVFMVGSSVILTRVLAFLLFL